MGADIHIRVQTQEPSGSWVTHPYVTTPWLSREEARARADANESFWQKQWEEFDGNPVALRLPPCFEARNYRLFSVLGDVRNGYGFAGVDTGDAWPVVVWPLRGLPEGVTEDGPGEYEENERVGLVWLGDHSYTWYMLEELESWNWDGVSREMRGLLTGRDFEAWDGSSMPSSWSGGVSGPNVVVTTPTEYREQLASATSLGLADTWRGNATRYVQCAWRVTARQATNDWIGQVGPVLRAFADGRPLRLVIGFDN